MDSQSIIVESARTIVNPAISSCSYSFKKLAILKKLKIVGKRAIKGGAVILITVRSGARTKGLTRTYLKIAEGCRSAISVE